MLNWLRRPDAKELGNEAFKEKNLDEAVLQYTRGLERCQGTAQTEERSKLLANRSAAHAKLGNFEAALADAEEAARLQPDWPKAWARKAAAPEVAWQGSAGTVWRTRHNLVVGGKGRQPPPMYELPRDTFSSDSPNPP